MLQRTMHKVTFHVCNHDSVFCLLDTTWTLTLPTTINAIDPTHSIKETCSSIAIDSYWRAKSRTSTVTSPFLAFGRHPHFACPVVTATSRPDGGFDAEGRNEKASPFDDQPGVERDCVMKLMSASLGGVVVANARPMKMQRDDGAAGCRVNGKASHVESV